MHTCQDLSARSRGLGGGKTGGGLQANSNGMAARAPGGLQGKESVRGRAFAYAQDGSSLSGVAAGWTFLKWDCTSTMRNRSVL